MKSKLPSTLYGSATKFAANAFGATDENDLDQLCFINYQDEEFLKRLFKQSYEHYQKDWLAFHLKKLVYLQQMVFEKAKIIQFIDMLPY